MRRRRLDFDVGAAIRAQLLLRDVPARELAAELDLHPSSLSRLLRGYRGYSDDELAALRAALEQRGITLEGV